MCRPRSRTNRPGTIRPTLDICILACKLAVPFVHANSELGEELGVGMGKGHYLGGGSLAGPRGRIGRAPGRGGTDCKASAEARRVARAKQKAEQRKLIKRNEKLARKLGKLWQEERGKALFQRLAGAALPISCTDKTLPTESALAQALREAGLIPDND